MRKWPLKRGGFFLGVKQFSSILLSRLKFGLNRGVIFGGGGGGGGGGATVLHNSVLHELWWCVSIREGKNTFNFTININWVVCPWLDSFLNYRILCNYNLSYSYTAHLMNEKHICYVCYMILKLYIQFWREKNYKFNIS